MPTVHHPEVRNPDAQARRGERQTGYYLLLASLLATVGVFPFLGENEALRRLLDLFVVLVLVTVIIAIYRRGSARVWVVALTLIAIGLSIANQFTTEGGTVEISRYMASVLALGGATWVILRDVLRREPVTTRKSFHMHYPALPLLMTSWADFNALT